MTKFENLHLALEVKAKAFLENPTEENGNKIIVELLKLEKENAMICIDGVASDVNPTVTVPSGYYAKDGKFYVHIFSSNIAFDASTATNPHTVHMQDLMHFVYDNEQIGGFSLNHTKDSGAILITKQDIDAIKGSFH